MESKCAPVSPTGEKLPSGENPLAGRKTPIRIKTPHWTLSLLFLFSVCQDDVSERPN
jgi:hypothetical protein